MNDLLSSVAHYYTDKIQRFGSEPRGVDWNGREGQVLRFAQLCKVLDPDTPFSVTDVGCGYGSLVDFLGTHFERFDYVGVDISDAMIGAPLNSTQARRTLASSSARGHRSRQTSRSQAEFSMSS
jgi:Cyclopropane fatty acid synthase and related methyltransferases